MKIRQLLENDTHNDIDFNRVAEESLMAMSSSNSYEYQDWLMEYKRKGGFESLEKHFNEWVIPKLIEEIEDNLDFIRATLQHGAVDGKYEIYRAIMAPRDWVSSGEYKSRNVGIYWTYEYGQVQAYRADTEYGNTLFIVSGLVDPKYIDWEELLIVGMTYGLEEEEVTLFEDSPIKLIAINVDDEPDNNLLLEPIQMKA